MSISQIGAAVYLSCAVIFLLGKISFLTIKVDFKSTQYKSVFFYYLFFHVKCMNSSSLSCPIPLPLGDDAMPEVTNPDKNYLLFMLWYK